MMKTKLQLIVVIIVIVSMSAGCTFFEKKKTKWRPVKNKSQVFLHEVQWEDETYEMIAKWYSGKKENTELIVNANPALNPEKLQVGDKVFIPKKIIRTRNNFLRKYVENFYKKTVKKETKKQGSVVQKKVKSDEKFELFGPR